MLRLRIWKPEAPLGRDVPGAAEKCFPCFLAGHYCRATEWWYEVAVCKCCLEGVLCEPQERVKRLLEWKGRES